VKLCAPGRTGRGQVATPLPASVGSFLPPRDVLISTLNPPRAILERDKNEERRGKGKTAVTAPDFDHQRSIWDSPSGSAYHEPDGGAFAARPQKRIPSCVVGGKVANPLQILLIAKYLPWQSVAPRPNCRESALQFFRL
jgi:hypothetical protein